jgi:hypothetical protein
MKSVILLGMLGPEYGIIKTLNNFGNNSPDNTVSYTRRLKSKTEIPVSVADGFNSTPLTIGPWLTLLDGVASSCLYGYKIPKCIAIKPLLL